MRTGLMHILSEKRNSVETEDSNRKPEQSSGQEISGQQIPGPAEEISGPDADAASEREITEEASGTGEQEAASNDPSTILYNMTHEERKLFLSMAGLSTFVKSTGRLFWTNFLMGLARGIGFVIGMSILGVICVAVWNEFLSVTGIGEFIARVLEEIHKHTPASP